MNYPNPKISVIIPVFNTAAYLQESVGSITGQTFKELEIIIINDGSTDDSPSILKSFAEKDERIILLTQQNSGLSVTRNRGLGIAKGDYIYFMDSDDILESDALELCYRKCISDSLDMVIFNGESFFEDKGQKPLFDYNIADYAKDEKHRGLDLFKTLTREYHFSTSCCLYLLKRSVIESHSMRFYPGIIHEDNLFTPLAYIYSNSIGLINRQFFKRRIRGNSIMTARITWRNINGYLIACSELLKAAKFMKPEGQSAVDLYVSRTMTAVCFKARKLPLNERIKYISIIIGSYKKYVPLKELLKVFFPKK